jgi:hypothetical protein
LEDVPESVPVGNLFDRSRKLNERGTYRSNLHGDKYNGQKPKKWQKNQLIAQTTPEVSDFVSRPLSQSGKHKLAPAFQSTERKPEYSNSNSELAEEEHQNSEQVACQWAKELARILKETLDIDSSLKHDETLFREFDWKNHKYTQQTLIQIVAGRKLARKTAKVVFSGLADKCLSDLQLLYHEDDEVLCSFLCEGMLHYLVIWSKERAKQVPRFQLIKAPPELVLSSKVELERYFVPNHIQKATEKYNFNEDTQTYSRILLCMKPYTFVSPNPPDPNRFKWYYFGTYAHSFEETWKSLKQPVDRVNINLSAPIQLPQ